jgi:hypothetical protein
LEHSRKTEHYRNLNPTPETKVKAMKKMVMSAVISIPIASFQIGCSTRINETKLASPQEPTGTEKTSVHNEKNSSRPKPRNLNDIVLDSNLTENAVLQIWGPPDGRRGSGVAYLEYTMRDGKELWLSFQPQPPKKLNGALLFSDPDSSDRVMLYPKQATINSNRQSH